jgi:hypothetical protein
MGYALGFGERLITEYCLYFFLQFIANTSTIFLPSHCQWYPHTQRCILPFFYYYHLLAILIRSPADFEPEAIGNELYYYRGPYDDWPTVTFDTFDTDSGL